MSGNTLFEPPASFSDRISELKKDYKITEARLLLEVELAFALMEYLELNDEPITVVWAILSGMFIKHPRLENLSAEKRRAIANCRQIVPFSSRFNWLNALRDYKRNIPQSWRNYDFDLQDLDNQIIDAARNIQQGTNRNICQSCLTAQLNYRRRKRGQVREEVLAQQYDCDGSTVSRGNWVGRFNRLNYHKVLQDNIIEPEPAQTLTIEDFTHVAGMVASGKSTLSLLLASHVIRNLSDRPSISYRYY